MIGELLHNHSRFATVVLMAAAIAMAMIIGASPALAEEGIEFRIVFEGRDQSCRTGSNKLSTGPAQPFLVEACAVEFGNELPDRTLTAMITHADGTAEEIIVTTGTSGSVIFEVVPVDGGLTTVTMCNDNGCDYGVLEFEADGPPLPPLIASYLGLTTDMQTSEPITDGEDDFDDPHTGGVAAPGSGDPAMDIKSFRYLGTEDGTARFEITTRGDIFSLFTSGLPLVQVSMAVTTPNNARYLITYRVSSGTVETYAESDGAPLDGVTVEIEEGSLILKVTGVDVPEGSTLRAGTWLIADNANSGYQDFADGTAIPATVAGNTDDPIAAETETPAETQASTPSGSDEEPHESAADDSSGGGSIPWIPVALVITALGGGAYAYTRTRQGSETAATPPPSDGLRTFSADDRAALQEVYKGADSAGLKVVGISEITRLEDVQARSKDDPVVIGTATKIEMGVTADGSLVSPDDEAATGSLSIEVVPAVEFDSDGDEHVVWRAYVRETDAAGTVKTSKSGPSSHEWEARIDGRSDAEIGTDTEFKDWVVESEADNPAEAVRLALEHRT